MEFSIEDIYKDALGFVEYRDRAGNVTVDTIIYIADKLEFYVDSLKLGNWLEFGSCWILDSTYTAVLKIRNVSKKEIHIQDLFLSGNEPMYSITKSIDDLPLTLGPDEEQEIEITYNPTISSITLDQITLYTDCLQFNLRISGSCGLPKIKVSDIDFGDILVGTKTRYNQKGSAVTLTITNNGASDLIITGFHFDPPQDSINGPFFYEAEDFGPEPPSIEKPWIIARNGGIKSGIRYFYFMPSEIGEYKALLYFENNIMDLDSNSNRKDYAIIKGNGIQDNTHIESGVDENNYSLLPVVPNPIKGNTLKINYSLGQSGDVNINIYNTAGELVKEVVNNSETAGEYSKTVNISDLVSGTYIITMKSRAYETQQQLMIVK